MATWIANRIFCHFGQMHTLCRPHPHYMRRNHGYTDTNTGWSSTYMKVTMVFVQPTVFMVFVISQPYTSEVGLYYEWEWSELLERKLRLGQSNIELHHTYFTHEKWGTPPMGVWGGRGCPTHPPPPENLKLYYQVILISWLYVALHTSTVFISALQIIITNMIIGLGLSHPIYAHCPLEIKVDHQKALLYL